MKPFFPFPMLLVALVALSLACVGPALAQAVKPQSTTEQYGTWSVNCRMTDLADAQVAAAEPARHCELKTSVNLRAEDGTQRRLIDVALGQKPDQQAFSMVVQVPPGAYLRDAVTVVLDPPKIATKAKALAELTYVSCAPNGRFAESSLSDTQLKLLQTAATARVEFVGAQRNRIGVPLSLIGLKDALAALAQK